MAVLVGERVFMSEVPMHLSCQVLIEEPEEELGAKVFDLGLRVEG